MLFNFIKEKVKKLYTGFTNKISSIFSSKKFDESFFKELSDLLISSDTGIKTTDTIIKKLTQVSNEKKIDDLDLAKKELELILSNLLEQAHQPEALPRILLMVGINGSGKTTFVAKIAHLLKKQGGRVLVVAGDTFRAAAPQQLAEWSKKVGCDLFMGKEGQDPASVIFDACKKFQREQYDHIVIDTAGRLQTKVNLMRELQKISTVIEKVLTGEKFQTWLTVDAMLGQNSLRQVELFHETTQLTGIVVTKLDGTGKGGIIFSLVDTFKLPIVYLTFGESLDEIKVFNVQEYVYGLLHE
jgi:fused signal recognition particle receptor